MKRSKVEHAVSKVAVNASPPPSDLAMDAIVAGLPVDETRPESAGTVEFSWPPHRTCL
ncbi:MULTISPECIES: hypothetical protein [Nocardiaceae]|uniref:hypothetical protein n=1 Tax=Nocardiaceae TaxID=85025 RepID=UPI000AB7261B|nr:MULTISPECIES: hypothetical protein [Rhodococcus]